MHAVLAVFRRELGSSFNAPTAYIALLAYLGLLGVFCLYYDDIFGAGLASPVGLFRWSALGLTLLVPAITMRLFAEERRTGSLELLCTLPLSEAQLVLGKFLAAQSLVCLGLTLTLSYPISLSLYGDLDWGAVLGGYLGLSLLGGAYAAMGLAASSVTSNQIVAFLLALIACLLPYTVGFFLHRVPAELLPWVQYISFDYHFSSLARGVLDSRALIFYATVIAAALHLAVFSLEQRRLSA